MRALICLCFRSVGLVKRIPAGCGPWGFWSCLSASSLSFQGSSAFEDPGEAPDAWAAERPQKYCKPKKWVMIAVVCAHGHLTTSETICPTLLVNQLVQRWQMG